MIKKIVILSVMLIMCLGVFFGCSAAKYNAEIFSHAKEWVNEEFLNENRVYGAYYLNEEYVEGDENSYKFLQDTTSPTTRNYIVTSQEEYNKIFVEFPSEINFDKEMLFVYIFSNIYPKRDYCIKRLKKDENKLKIVYKLKNINSNILDAAMPYQRCLVVKTLKIDVTEVQFEETR